MICKSAPAAVPHRPARASLPPRSAPRARGQLRAVRRVDNFVNILPGDEDLEVEEDVLSELGDSDEDGEDPPKAVQNLIDLDSDDDVSVLRMMTVPATAPHPLPLQPKAFKDPSTYFSLDSKSVGVLPGIILGLISSKGILDFLHWKK